MKIVVSHNNADLDGLACMVAATRVYEGAVAVGGTSLSPPVHRYLALHKDHYPLLSAADIDPGTVEEVILVDVRDSRRLKEIQPILDRGPRIIAWDHHPSSEWDVPVDEEIVEPVGACITLLVERMLERSVPISVDEATLYMLGLYSDTGRLSYTSTNTRDLRVAAALLERGAQLNVVNRYLRHALSGEQRALLVELLGSTREISIDAVEVAIATASTRKTISGASTVVQQVMELGGHDAMFAAIYFEKNKRVQIIGRSRVSYVDVGKLMREFGGGGHRGAGAGSIKGSTVEDVTTRLEGLLRSSPLTPTRVREIMSSPVRFVPHDTDLGEAGTLLEQWTVTGAPVTRDGELCGIISRRDIARAGRNEALTLPVASYMSHDVQCIDGHEPIEDVLERMTAADVGRMPVVEEGELVGIVTRTDLIRLLYMKTRDDSDLL